MRTTEINIQELSGKRTVTRDDGRVIYKKIKDLWSDHDRISVDFVNLQVASVSFMDEAFGHLALEHSEQELRSKLAFKNMSEFDRALLNDIFASRIRERLLKNRGKPRSSKARLKLGVRISRGR